MKLKRLSALALCAALPLCAAGCGGGAEAGLASTGESGAFAGRLSVSIAFWNIQEMADMPSEKDGVQRYIEDKFNIKVEPVNVSWSDYEERYNIMAATNSLPDVFATNMTGGSLSFNLDALVKKNAIRALPGDLSGFPLVARALQQSQGGHKQLNGKNYTVPRTSFEDQTLSSSDAGLLVRKDWMEALGIGDPQSFEEFKAMLARFVNDDPDGNGEADTLGMNVNNRAALGKWTMLGLAPECNVYTWVEQGGRLVPSYTLPSFERVAAAYRELYESGALDPDFHVKKSNDAIYDFVKGKLGALEYKSSPTALSEVVTQWGMYQNRPFEDCVKLLHIFPAPDGVRYRNTSSPSWSESAFSAKVDDEKMERMLSLYEYLMSEDGWRLTRLGMEGEDYTVNSAAQKGALGRYQFAENSGSNGNSTALSQKYPSLELFASLASWGGDWEDFRENDVNIHRYGATVMEMSYNELLWNNSNAVPVERPYRFFPFLQDGSLAFSQARVVDSLTQVIIGERDPVLMWREVLAQYDKDGLQTYIDQKNEEISAAR